MGIISENQKVWTNRTWRLQGNDWSRGWGGTELLWWGTILPRIHAFVPTEAILEIAPGFGRCTQYLKDLCQHLTVVDLTEKCIEACKQRFSSCSHITYYVNDGKSLDMIADQSIDFVFSYDSLVHVEADVIEAYLSQLARKLKPNGVGLVHHSNLGAYVSRLTGKLPFYIDNKLDGSNWRGESVTAILFEAYCEKVNLQCISQEIIVLYPESSIKWGRPGGRLQGRISRRMIDRYGRVLNDCFSLFTQKNSVWVRPNRVLVNRKFWDEAKNLSRLSGLYAASSFKKN
jgi:SAM-dependent methyltransferase